MRKRRRVALMLELHWGYARHVSLFAGTQQYAQESGHWDCTVDERAAETLRCARRSCPYDGIIARATPALAAQVRRWNIPVVNTWFDSPAEDLPRVSKDFYATGRMAAEHLLGLGLRRFSCLAIKNNRAQALQTAAFHELLAAAGYTCRCTLVPSGRQVSIRQRFHQSLGSLIDGWTPPVGCFVTLPDMTTRYVANAVAKRGLRIPEDVALIAGCDEPMLCLHPAPALTNIEVSYEAIGYRAAQLLDSLMSGRRVPERPILLPPLRVAARESTDFRAIDDEEVAAALQFLVAHIDKPLHVRDVARAASTSLRTLQRRFVAALGRTIAEEIRRLRIERAKRFLLDTNLPVKAVARSAGFANEQRMSEAFRRSLGIAPTEYRTSRGPRS